MKKLGKLIFVGLLNISTSYGSSTDPLNIVTTTNDNINYVAATATLIQSVKENTQGQKLVTILTPDLSNDNSNKLLSMQQEGAIKINIVHISSEMQENLKKYKCTQWSELIMIKLFFTDIPELQNMKDFLYIDSDIINVRDLAGLFKQGRESRSPITGVEVFYAQQLFSQFKVMGYDEQEQFSSIGGGVLYFNTPKLKADFEANFQGKNGLQAVMEEKREKEMAKIEACRNYCNDKEVSLLKEDLSKNPELFFQLEKDLNQLNSIETTKKHLETKSDNFSGRILSMINTHEKHFQGLQMSPLEEFLNDVKFILKSKELESDPEILSLIQDLRASILNKPENGDQDNFELIWELINQEPFSETLKTINEKRGHNIVFPPDLVRAVEGISSPTPLEEIFITDEDALTAYLSRAEFSSSEFLMPFRYNFVVKYLAPEVANIQFDLAFEDMKTNEEVWSLITQEKDNAVLYHFDQCIKPWSFDGADFAGLAGNGESQFLPYLMWHYYLQKTPFADMINNRIDPVKKTWD